MNATTIYALSSGPGPSGVAVIRFSGPEVVRIFEMFCGFLPKPRYAALCHLQNPLEDGVLLDQALVLYFKGPKSFTGEDAGEFHVHGGRAVVADVLAALGSLCFTRMAEAGEFTRRGFENGKLDLVEVEGLGDLISAETSLQKRLALQQMGGAFSSLYDKWRGELIRAQAYLEASLDFSDEGDVGEDIARHAVQPVKDLLTILTGVLSDQHKGEIVREGFHVVIAGLPNAGKSRLMNALAKRDVAIVSDEAGTTRDVIEVKLDLDGMAVVVLDTAGVRDAVNKVEAEGIRRSFATLDRADLVLWVMDGGLPGFDLPSLFVSYEGPLLRVWNKADLVRPQAGDLELVDLVLSAETGEGLDQLIEKIKELAVVSMPSQEGVTITRARHRECIMLAVAALEDFLSGDLNETELRAEDLRKAAFALGRLTGKVDVEDILDHLFFEFCIGK